MGFLLNLFKPYSVKTDAGSEGQAGGKGAPAAPPRGESPVRTVSFKEPVRPAIQPPPVYAVPKPVETPEEFLGRRLTVDLGALLGKIPPHFVKSGRHDAARRLSFPIEDLFDGIAQGRPHVRLTSVAKECPEIFRSDVGPGDDIDLPLSLRDLVNQIGAFPPPKDQKPAPQVVDGTPFAVELGREFAAPPAASPAPEEPPVPAEPEPEEPVDSREAVDEAEAIAEDGPLQANASLPSVSEDLAISEGEPACEAPGNPAPEPSDVEPVHADDPPPSAAITPEPSPEPAPEPASLSAENPSPQDTPSAPENSEDIDPAPLPEVEEPAQTDSVSEESAPQNDPDPEPEDASSISAVATVEPSPESESAYRMPTPPTPHRPPSVQLIATLPPRLIAERTPALEVESSSPNEGRLVPESPEGSGVPETAAEASPAETDVPSEDAAAPAPAPLEDAPEPPSRRPRPLSLAREQTALQSLFHADDALDLADVAALVADLPAVRGCIVHSGGHVERAGEIPGFIDADSLADAGTALFDPVAGFAARLQVGDVQNLTIGNEDILATLFRSGRVTMFVLHRGRDFPPGMRARLAATTLELARLA